MSCNGYPDISRWVPAFAGFTEFTPTIPKMYWDVKSQEQRLKAICAQIHKLICYSDMLSGKINDDHDAIAELQELFDTFMESGFDDYYLEQIEEWVNNNLEELFHLLVKQVYFGLTLEGYFVAYSPESWDDIIFDTGMVYGVDTYGRLILRWDVDNSGENVDQRPEGWN